MKNLISVVAFAAIAATANAGSAVDLANWTFETSVPTTAGPHVAEGGLFAATSQASGFHTSGATVYSNPVGNGTFESFSSNNWSTGDYYQFQTSTLGYEDLTFSFEQTRSSTGPANFNLEWSIDGSSFSNLAAYVVDQVTWSSGAFVAGSSFAFALPAGAENQASIWLRLTSQVTTASGGTNRVDAVVVSGVLIPTPGAMGLLAVAGVVATRRRRA